MSEQENSIEGTSDDDADGERQAVAQPPTGGLPLILYDLATLVGAVYQQRITTTRQERVAKRIADLLRPRLHGLPRFDEQQVDTYIDMLCGMARRLELINIVSPFYEGEDKPYYRPSVEAGLEKWARLNAYEQARAFLVKWKRSREWHDIWSADIRQWDASDWDPLAARRLLLDLLSAGMYEPERWYLVSPLFDAAWLRGPFILRPTRQKERKRTQDFPYALRNAWNRCDRLVYLGILSSTLSELGIVSLASHPADSITGSPYEPTRFKLSSFGAQVLFKQPPPSTERSNRMLVVQPSFEVIVLQFHPPGLYRLLPFAEVKLVEQASRLTLTRNSVLRGLEADMSIDDMITILNASSKKAVPQNVIRTMQDWAKAYRGAETAEILQIKVSSEAVADELCSSPRWREYGLEKIAPNRLLAHTVYDPLEFRRRLKQAGIVIHD